MLLHYRGWCRVIWRIPVGTEASSWSHLTCYPSSSSQAHFFFFFFLKIWLWSSPYSRWASMRSQCSPCLMYRTSSVMLLCWLNASITESSSWKNSIGGWGRHTVTESYLKHMTTVWVFFLMVLWASRGKARSVTHPYLDTIKTVV